MLIWNAGISQFTCPQPIMLECPTNLETYHISDAQIEHIHINQPIAPGFELSPTEFLTVFSPGYFHSFK